MPELTLTAIFKNFKTQKHNFHQSWPEIMHDGDISKNCEIGKPNWTTSESASFVRARLTLERSPNVVIYFVSRVSRSG
jgi:hypothetical protein